MHLLHSLDAYFTSTRQPCVAPLAKRVLNNCEENRIVLQSFPPHPSHQLHPLDRTVIGLLKRYRSAYAGGWLKSHPGIPMTIYDISTVLKEALPHATIPANNHHGFVVTGIWPFNREIFQDDESVASEVTITTSNWRIKKIWKKKLLEIIRRRTLRRWR
ncbi:hypothetical protein JTB14_037656 [Gonioctena quinquepunctata]|nr:hypothetical protein JTB14_037656 [Gonioctena quinquepunctata]